MTKLNVLIICETSGTLRRRFQAAGHTCTSIDVLPADDDGHGHIQGDAIQFLRDECAKHGDARPYDLIIAHPPCTRLANSGVRWLHTPPAGRTREDLWEQFNAAVDFYRAVRTYSIRLAEHVAIENPIMHRYARERIGSIKRHVVQPWWFGDAAFKATGWELHALPVLRATERLEPPAKGTDEHKAWSFIHRASPGPLRWKVRSKTFDGMADAIVDQWSRFAIACRNEAEHECPCCGARLGWEWVSRTAISNEAILECHCGVTTLLEEAL